MMKNIVDLNHVYFIVSQTLEFDTELCSFNFHYIYILFFPFNKSNIGLLNFFSNILEICNLGSKRPLYVQPPNINTHTG